MTQMSVDDLVKLLDGFSQKGGASIKPQFEDGKTNFVVGNGEKLSGSFGKNLEEMTELLVEEENKNAELFTAESASNCVSCANIPNMKHIDNDTDYE